MSVNAPFFWAVFFRFRGRYLDFRQNDTVDFVGDGTIEKPTPENMGYRHQNYVPI